MKNSEISHSTALLWRITAGVAIILLVFTLMLVVKTRTITSAGFTGYISGQNTIVYLRIHPTDTSHTVAILNPGTAVFVDHSTTRNDITWYHIKTESDVGWIPETHLSLTNP